VELGFGKQKQRPFTIPTFLNLLKFRLIFWENMEKVCEFCGAWFWEAETMPIHDPGMLKSAEI